MGFQSLCLTFVLLCMRHLEWIVLPASAGVQNHYAYVLQHDTRNPQQFFSPHCIINDVVFPLRLPKTEVCIQAQKRKSIAQYLASRKTNSSVFINTTKPKVHLELWILPGWKNGYALLKLFCNLLLCEFEHLTNVRPLKKAWASHDVMTSLKMLCLSWN